jgi:hypothetical protein
MAALSGRALLRPIIRNFKAYPRNENHYHPSKCKQPSHIEPAEPSKKPRPNDIAAAQYRKRDQPPAENWTGLRQVEEGGTITFACTFKVLEGDVEYPTIEVFMKRR